MRPEVNSCHTLCLYPASGNYTLALTGTANNISRALAATSTYRITVGYNSLGTTRKLSDSSGQISDRYRFEAFGNLLSRDGETDNTHLYTGERYDPELDNYYLRARYYGQGVGRFTQLDEWMGVEFKPIALNKYVYRKSDPTNHW